MSESQAQYGGNADSTPEIVLLKQAREMARKKVEEDPSRANLEAWEKACRMIEERTAPKEPAEEVFDNRLAVLAYLKGHGYKLAKSKIYNDAKAGLLRLQPDGSVLDSDVKRYIRLANVKKVTETNAQSRAVEISLKTKEKELEKVSEQVAKLRREREVLEGGWFSKDDFFMELAARAAVLDSGMRHAIHTRLAEYVRVVDGDPDKAYLLLEKMMTHWDELLNQYATMDSFQVVFEEE